MIIMNEIINNFSLAGEKFMPEMHLRQRGFTYSACGPFTKSKERIQKFKETRDASYIYKNELERYAFNMIWLMETLKILQKELQADKVLRDRAFKIASDQKYDGY